MLDVSMAKKLIERVTEYTSYNVNIMNEDGVIIASRIRSGWGHSTRRHIRSFTAVRIS